MLDSRISVSENGTSVRKYTRGELFELARSMADVSTEEHEILHDLETADRSNYNIDLLEVNDFTGRRYGSTRLLSSTGRQHSELSSGFFSNSADIRRGDQKNYPQGGGPRLRLSRMTSSPSIDYKIQQPQACTSSQHVSSISSQVQAKYAKLIETLTSPGKNTETNLLGDPQSNPRQTTSARSSSQNLRLSTGSDSGTRVERPTRMFGPLRWDNVAQDKFRNEEAASLPYSANYTFSNQNLNDNSSQFNKRRGQNLLSCSTRRHDESSKHDDSEDDFDISSLLNITVLSDIRTIRQQSVNITPAKTSKPMRPLTRARTATEFSYDSRSRSKASSRPQQGYLMPENQVEYPSSCADLSIQSNYEWSRENPYEISHEVARTSRQPDVNRLASPVRDEKEVKIIETFKALVKARASEPLDLKVSSQADHSNPLSDKVRLGKNMVDQEGQTSLEKGETKSRVDPPARTEVSSGNDKAETSCNHEIRVTLQNLKTEVVEKSSEVVAPECEETTGKLTIKTSFVSNIPRSIRLHRLETVGALQKPSLKTGKPIDVVDEKSLSSLPAQAVDNKSVKESTKFVSQYKRLRGKSLADEVEEATS